MSLHEDGENALRAHIQDILLDYALTHLTTDYVAYTHGAIEELLLPNLHLVSTTDPTSFVLEPSITKTIASTFITSELPSYEERWYCSAQVTKHLKQSNINPPGQNPSERYWSEDWDGCKGRSRPFSPALTIKAIKETPKLGAGTAAEHCPDPSRLFAEKFRIDKVEVESIETIKLDIDSALGNRLIFDDDVYRSANALLKNVLAFGHQQLLSEDQNVREFLRAQSPAHTCTQLFNIPIFARTEDNITYNRNSFDSASHAPGAKSISDLPSLLVKAPQNEDSQEELYKQHMVLVNGWQAFEFPSSPLNAPTPSLGSSSSQVREVDELFLLSPPGTSYVRDLENARMDGVEVPRSEKIGGARRQEGQALGEGQSLSTFLGTFQLSQAPDFDLRVVTSPKSQPRSPRTSITASMLGQLGDPSELSGVGRNSLEDYDNNPSSKNNIASDDLVGVLRTVFKENLPKDPCDFILNEKLDERESLLMDVPDLPSPAANAAAKSNVPISFSSMLLAPVTMPQVQMPELSVPRPMYAGFLQCIKGLKSLNMELSWRPFNFGTSMPTDEKVCHLDKNVRAECVEMLEEIYGTNRPPCHSDLATILSTSPDRITPECNPGYPDPSEVAWSCEGQLGETTAHSIADGSMEEFVRTAAERRRLYGLPDELYENEVPIEEQSDDWSKEQPPSKRAKYPEECENTTPKIVDTPERPIRVVRFEEDSTHNEEDEYSEYVHEFDDSGIYIPQPGYSLSEQNITSHVSIFGGLADAAEGYEGPDEDGDVLPDIDPLHMNLNGFDELDYICWPDDTVSALRDVQALEPVAPLLPPAIIGNSPKSHNELDFFQQDPRDRQATSGQHPNDNLADRSTAVNSKERPLTAEPDHETLAITQAASASRSLREFMRLRSKVTGSPLKNKTTTDASQARILAKVPSTRSHASLQIPSELLDKYILTIPNDYVSAPRFMHRYLASLTFIQKRGLVRALSRQSVDLVEREHLGDVDMILDQDTAVLFISLRALPAQCEALSGNINRLSWHFLYVLVLFEAFPPSTYLHAENDHSNEPVANPFSPPVIKAVKKLKRDMGIAQACDDKRAETVVHISFPLTVDEAAKAVRIFGDMAHHRDETGGLLWDDRQWLDVEDEDTDEQDLAAIDGMNVFAAGVVLANVSLDDFLDKTPQERMDEFGSLIGVDRIVTFNRVITRRIEAMQLPPSSPPATSLGTSNPEATNEMAAGLDDQVWSFGQ